MARIIFFCPPVTVINGGIKHIFRMAESLIALGHDAVVFEQEGRRPTWFASTAPVVGQGIFDHNPSEIYVLPEDQPEILAMFKDFPQKKVVYSQNHFYGVLGVGSMNSYADYGVTHILCSSRTIYDHAHFRFPNLKAYVVPCAVDATTFKPGTKKNQIAFMPRKRPIESAYIRDMFRFSFPQHQSWEWKPLTDMSEADVGRSMGEAEVFLSLSKLEGFGLTPLEAMAANCVVAGFTGIGGREYATKENGFWAGEDDFPLCVDQLKNAVELSLAPDAAKTAYRDATRKTVAGFTPETFNKGVKDAWAQILA